MEALDFFIDGERVTRLQSVKNVVAEFIKNRPNDRIGMVVFGEDAFTQAPQTLDHGILLSFLEEVKIGMAGDRTAIGLAVGIAVKRIKDLPSKSKVLILLTDGSNNVNTLSPEKASEIAKSFGVKIYTIGVGSKGKAPFLVEGIFGQRLVYQQVDIDEETLKKIADITGGRYYRATDTESLKKIYDEIDQLERTEITRREYVEYEEHYAAFSFFGLGFLLLEILLGHTFFRKLP
jgi:Ca-activated chloride channel family protein